MNRLRSFETTKSSINSENLSPKAKLNKINIENDNELSKSDDDDSYVNFSGHDMDADEAGHFSEHITDYKKDRNLL